VAKIVRGDITRTASQSIFTADSHIQETFVSKSASDVSRSTCASSKHSPPDSSSPVDFASGLGAEVR